jgi:CRP/FNR family transcriptional regulator, cyclic AMP receptor protein
MAQRELLHGLSPHDAEHLLSLGTRIILPKSTVLFRLGGQADSLYVVERGHLALTLPMQVMGHEENILIEERHPGQTLGWSALIPPHKFTLTATAPFDAEVLALDRQALLQYFTAEPAVGYVVTRNVAEIIGQRLQVFQGMWLREMQRVVEMHTARKGTA